ncbi:hypothetical protein BpHYR1_025168, partial [Brachionus plicatilis]
MHCILHWCLIYLSKKEMLTKQFIFISHFIVQQFICGLTSKEKELDCPNPKSFEYKSSHYYHNSYPFLSYDN